MVNCSSDNYSKCLQWILCDRCKEELGSTRRAVPTFPALPTGTPPSPGLLQLSLRATPGCRSSHPSHPSHRAEERAGRSRGRGSNDTSRITQPGAGPPAWRPILAATWRAHWPDPIHGSGKGAQTPLMMMVLEEKE